MFEYIRGKLTEKETGRITVDVHGVGYDISIPLSTFNGLPAIETEVKVYIHYHVREDALKLFGFASRQEREIFRQLLSVSQIGPKVGMSILSGMSLDTLLLCINQGDSARLSKIPGIGAKTAQRIIIELKGKVAKIDGGLSDSTAPSDQKILNSNSIRSEAYAAMVSLGYNDKQVDKALDRVAQAIGQDAPIEEWIKKTLQVI